MKFNVSYILCFIIGLSFIACSDDELASNAGNIMTLTATIEDLVPGTRVRYESTEKGAASTAKKLNWKDDDEIMLFRVINSTSDINKLYTKNTVVDGNITQTSLASENAMTWTNGSYTYKAVYPYDRCTSLNSSGYTVTLPAIQKVGVAPVDSILTNEYWQPIRWNAGTNSYETYSRNDIDSDSPKRTQYNATDYSSCLLYSGGTINVSSNNPNATMTFYAMTRAIDIVIDAPQNGRAMINYIKVEYGTGYDAVNKKLTGSVNIAGTLTGSGSGPSTATENYVKMDLSEASALQPLQGTDRLVARAFLIRSLDVSNKHVEVSVNCTLYDEDGNNGIEHTFFKVFRYQGGVGVGANIDEAYMGKLPSHEEYVDLGLSVLWAKRNIGASTMTDPGTYYAWASTEEKTSWNFDTYKTLPTSAISSQKFAYTNSGNNYYRDPNGTSRTSMIGSRYDVAHARLGGKWYMPTKDELEELANPANCEWTWDPGKKVYKVKSKKVGYTDNYIYLPAGKDGSQGSVINYWSGEKNPNGSESRNDSKAWALTAENGVTNPSVVEIERYSGLLVRPIRKK